MSDLCQIVGRCELSFVQVELEDVTDPAPGDSSVQRSAEPLMIRWLEEQLGVDLRQGYFPVDGGRRVTVDGWSEEPPILVEAWAHQGPPKPAQTNKVTSDAFKLTYLRHELGVDARLILLFSDEEAARPFQAGSWRAHAFSQAGIEIWVAELAPDIRAAIRDARKRQYR